MPKVLELTGANREPISVLLYFGQQPLDVCNIILYFLKKNVPVCSLKVVFTRKISFWEKTHREKTTFHTIYFKR